LLTRRQRIIADDSQSDNVNSERVVLKFRLDDLDVDEDAGVARYVMEPAAVLRWLAMLHAAATGLHRVEVDVRGQG
jgi:hypothetical protein